MSARSSPPSVVAMAIEASSAGGGPEGGAGLIGDGVADAATIADLKGRHMTIGPVASLFDAVPSVAS